MTEYYGYIYKTTNLINGKIYIGQRQSSVKDSNYFGSGILILKALRKYGKGSFKSEIICWVKSQVELNQAEIDFIKAFNSTAPDVGYNLSKGGAAFNKGRVTSPETKEKLRQAHLGKVTSDATKKKLSACQKGKPKSEQWKRNISEGQKGKIISDKMREHLRTINIGRSPSDATRKIIAEKATGRKLPQEACEKIRSRMIGNTLWVGRKHTAETKKKIAEAHRGRICSEETKEKIRQTKARNKELSLGVR